MHFKVEVFQNGKVLFVKNVKDMVRLHGKVLSNGNQTCSEIYGRYLFHVYKDVRNS